MKLRKTLIGIAGMAALFLASEANRVYAQAAPRNQQELEVVNRRLEGDYGKNHRYSHSENTGEEHSAPPTVDPFIPSVSLALYLLFRKENTRKKI